MSRRSTFATVAGWIVEKSVPLGSDQPIRVLVHPAFPRMIGRGKEDVGVQALCGVPVSGKLFTVVVGNGVDMLA